MAVQLAPVNPGLLIEPTTLPLLCPTCQGAMSAHVVTRHRRCLRCSPVENATLYAGIHLLVNSNRMRRSERTDQMGANVQRMILEYIVRGVNRAELSDRYGWCERQVQSRVGGRSWGAYGQPVIDRLRDLGIQSGKGQRTVSHNASRYVQIADAQRITLRRLLLNANDQEARLDARLLTIGRGPS